ncbi:hypothetical protein [Actinoplanes sp. GCM10030250]|uniref:hypothetical protein n=1 Tax=Actinoplanes sp. GCM10030250 TaxID=3273376 RepID=UPI0036060931
MDSARPLRDVFADLAGTAGDPAEVLRDAGHPALPDELVAEAVVSYADTAPVEVAEHLAPYVSAHSVVGAQEPDGEPGEHGALDLLTTAPVGEVADGFDDLAPAGEFNDGADDAGFDPGPGLDFGTGAEAAPLPVVEDDGLEEDPADPADLDWPAEPSEAPDAVMDSPVEATVDDGDADDDDDEPDLEPLG